MQSVTELSISKELRSLLRSARSAFVLTGAGISAESGVPTFRGGNRSAVWKGMPFDLISSAGMVERDLPAVWEWFDYRRELLRSLSPNPGHLELARWQSKFAEWTLVTQNVDGLHHKAGSRDVLELHGSIWRARCTACNSRYAISAQRGRPEACLECGAPLRPDVVLFGELLPPGTLERAAEKASTCELCFIIGTSAIVYPAASLPEVAKAGGAYLCEVNPERTPLSQVCDEVLTGNAGHVLPILGTLLDRN